MIGSSKNSTENCPRNCFWTQEKEARVKFNPGLSANRPSQKTGCISSSKLTLSIKFNNPFVTKILWSQEALRNFHFDYPLKTQLLLFSRVIVTSFGSFLHHTKSCSKSFLASQNNNFTLGMENTSKIYFSKSLLISLNRPKLIKRSIVDNSIHWIMHVVKSLIHVCWKGI